MANTSLLLFYPWLLLFALQLVSASGLRSTYIVHMDNSEMPKAFSSHHNWYTSILESLSGDTTVGTDTNTPTLVYTYKSAIHGFSAVLSVSELHSVSSSPGFVSAYPDRPVELHTTHTYEFLSLNPVTGLWPASNYGEDVVIGVVDTGIWPESRSFSDSGIKEIPAKWKGECEEGTSFNSSMCNRKLIGARTFNKGLLTNNPEMNITMNSTRDEAGHGTHTSSTAAGNYVEGATYFGYGSGVAAGMAPHARVAMYKALWGAGFGTASDVIAAIDKAIEDGVDVMSISLGFGRIPLYEDPMAIAAFAAMEKGIFISVSAGNAGPSYSTMHTGAPWLLSVGASTVDRNFAGTVTLGDGSIIVGTSLFPENAIISEVPLVYNSTIKNCDNAAQLSSEAQDQIVFCDNLRNPRLQMYEVCNSEAAGAIIITDDYFFLEIGSYNCPSVVIKPNSEEFITLMQYINTSTNPLVSIKFQQTVLGVSSSPAVAAFSSRGPSGAFPNILKPDLIAPGSKIIAAWPSNIPTANLKSRWPLGSDFNLESGTSMACPHAAGVAALLKGAHPDWSPAAIRSAMITTTSVLDNTLNPIRDTGNKYESATPLAMGAGHINPNKALDPGLVYDADASDYVSLLCAMNYTSSQILAITRSSSYNCSNSSSDINHPSLMAFFNISTSDTVTQEFQRTVTNVGDGAATYKVKLVPMKGFSIRVEPDTLVFQEKNEKLDFTVVIEGVLDGADVVSDGALIWVDEGEKHSVRSPIVATNIEYL